MNKTVKNRLLIYLCLFMAFIVDSYNFPSSFQFIKPSFVLLVLIYWNMALPDKVGITTALLFGVLEDLLQSSILGLHGLLFVLITYLCQRFFYQFRITPIWQQSFLVFILAILVKQILALDFLDSEFNRTNLSDNYYFISTFYYAILSSLSWPLVYYLCRLYRRRWVKI
jgi:rod shape-determining protein MreD